MMDETYRLSSRELGIALLKTIGITGVIMLLFYRSFWAVVWLPVVGFFVLRQTKIDGIEKANSDLQSEFLHGIGVLNGALQAGFSMENAWKEVEMETRILHGESSLFYMELKEMNRKVAHNAPLEKLFLDFAYKSKLEDIMQFAELLEFGKRSGGNWKQIIDVTVSQMTEQQEARKQIEVMVAEKKMEQQIMNVVPLGLLAFLQFTAWDYMSVMYHNLFGVICMTIFGAGYAGAIFLSQRILKVQV